MKKTAEIIAQSNELTTAQLGLRFDRVALRLWNDLKTASVNLLPTGFIAIITVTAPIRLPAKTSETIEKKIALLIKAKKTMLRTTAHGNQVQIRIVKNTSSRQIKMIGFVHNPTTPAKQLLDLAEAWI